MKKIKKQLRNKSALEIARLCGRAGLGAKAEELMILDVSQLSSFSDYFVIMSGRSTRHVQGLAAAVEEEMGKKRLSTSTSEGLSEGLWILLDYTDVVVHIFYHETRKFYDLEGLWHDAPQVTLEEA